MSTPTSGTGHFGRRCKFRKEREKGLFHEALRTQNEGVFLPDGHADVAKEIRKGPWCLEHDLLVEGQNCNRNVQANTYTHKEETDPNLQDRLPNGSRYLRWVGGWIPCRNGKNSKPENC